MLLFDAVVNDSLLAEAEQFLVCAIPPSGQSGLAGCQHSRSIDDWVSFGYALGVMLRDNPYGSDILRAFVQSATDGLSSTRMPSHERSDLPHEDF